jgi:hypothetical protein
MNENVFGKGVGVKFFFGGMRESRDNLEYLFCLRSGGGLENHPKSSWSGSGSNGCKESEVNGRDTCYLSKGFPYLTEKVKILRSWIAATHQHSPSSSKIKH